MNPVEITDPHKAAIDKEQEFAIGIDFGTTNSVISVFADGEITQIEDDAGNALIKSIVGWDGEKFLVGSDLSNFSGNKIYSVKRLLGKSSADVKQQNELSKFFPHFTEYDENSVHFAIGDKKYKSWEIASEIFKHLRKNLDNYLRKAGKKNPDIAKAVVTVPAYFDDAARGQVMLAAKLAGFDAMRLLAEPTAAAYAHGVQKKTRGTYLVYDLGGGTFDVSLIEIEKGIIQVIELAGDNMFGGDDIDIALCKKIFGEVTPAYLKLSKRIKEAFSRFDSVEFSNPKTGIQTILHSEDFDKIIKPQIKKTISLAMDAHKRAGSPALDGVLLVGGSTRIKLIEQMIAQNFDAPVMGGVDRDKIVSIGACMQAKNLMYKNDDILVDANPLSIGIELYGGINEKIIERAAPLPCTAKYEFTTHADNQTGMQFHITQGEREMALDCRSLARFELKNLPRRRSGQVKIEVIFALDSNNILSISAIEKESGRVQDITISPSFGLSESEVTKAIEDSYINARLDHEIRLRRDAINFAEKTANNILGALDKIEGSKINTDDKKTIKEIRSCAQDLLQSLASADRGDIEQKIENLQNISSKFIMAKLNLALGQIYKNKNIDQI